MRRRRLLQSTYLEPNKAKIHVISPYIETIQLVAFKYTAYSFSRTETFCRQIYFNEIITLYRYLVVTRYLFQRKTHKYAKVNLIAFSSVISHASRYGV